MYFNGRMTDHKYQNEWTSQIWTRVFHPHLWQLLENKQKGVLIWKLWFRQNIAKIDIECYIVSIALTVSISALSRFFSTGNISNQLKVLLGLPSVSSFQQQELERQSCFTLCVTQPNKTLCSSHYRAPRAKERCVMEYIFLCFWNRNFLKLGHILN